MANKVETCYEIVASVGCSIHMIPESAKTSAFPAKRPLEVRLRYHLYNLRGVLGYLGLFGNHTPPLIVFGCPRSGTQFLARALATHPEIEDKSEAALLWDKYYHTKANDTCKEAHEVRTTDLIRLRGNFRFYQWRSGKTVVMNRHPQNSLRIHFIKHIFPEAKLVHIVRDARAVVCSAYRSVRLKPGRQIPFSGYLRPPGWREHIKCDYLDQLSFMWNQTVIYASDAIHDYPGDFVEFRYEDLFERYEQIIESIWALAGFEPVPDLLNQLPRFESRNFKWQTELEPAQIELIEKLAYEGLRRFNYL